MAWQTLTAASEARDRLEQQINQSGVGLVTALAALIDLRWLEDAAQRDKLRQTLKGFREHPGAAGVLNVVVFDAVSQQAAATARDEVRFSITEGETVRSPLAESAGVEVRSFAYEGIPARSFSLALPGALPGEMRAGSSPRVAVYLSAATIDGALERVTDAMLRVSVVACLAAAAASFLLAQYLTRPIRTLVRDMKHVSLGHLDHQARVRSGDELGDLAQAFNGMTAGLKAAQEARLSQKAVEHELRVATQIQARLLPDAVPELPGLQIAHHYSPAREVGGDYFDFIRIDARHMGIAVADVSGKGIPASLIMTMTRSLLRMAARAEPSPARTIELLNRFLTPDMGPGMFVTIAYVVIDLEAREARLVRAGHNPPLLYSPSHGRVLHLHPRGIAVGIDREGSLFRSELQVQRFPLASGEVLVMYTDGIVEGKDRAGNDYSEERLERVLAECAEQPAAAIARTVIDDLERHRQGAEPSDDVTLLVLRVL